MLFSKENNKKVLELCSLKYEQCRHWGSCRLSPVCERSKDQNHRDLIAGERRGVTEDRFVPSVKEVDTGIRKFGLCSQVLVFNLIRILGTL